MTKNVPDLPIQTNKQTEKETEFCRCASIVGQSPINHSECFCCYEKNFSSTNMLVVIKIEQKINTTGSGCGSVDKAVASDTRGQQFKSSHW